MALFPSIDWLNELKEMLNKSSEYKEAAADFEGSFTIVCGRDSRCPEDFYMWINPYHGQILEVAQMSREDEREADFLLRAPYSVWKSLVKGEIGSMGAIVTGKIGVDGDVTKLLRRQKASEVLLKVISKVPTEFLDEV